MHDTRPYYAFRAAFADVIDPVTHTMEWLDERVARGAMQVWGNDDACLLTELRHYPTGAFEVHVMIAAGDKAALTGPIIETVEAWAARIGAAYVTIASRPAWARIMASKGYETHQVETRKVV